jgi:hypothetical protein
VTQRKEIQPPIDADKRGQTSNQKQIGICQRNDRSEVMLENSLFFQPSHKILETGKTRRTVEKLTNFLRLILFLSIFVVAAHAQQSSGEEDEDLIKPTRPGIANPAEFQKSGVLQIEYGYDGNFRADEFRSQQTAPLTIRFALVERVLLDFNIDTVISEKDEMGMRETGVGDTRVGVQVLALKDTERHPALAFAFYAKLPTASDEKNLGAGRTDISRRRFVEQKDKQNRY